MTVAELVADALLEIGALAAGQTASGPLASVALTRLNRLLDQWNADRGAVYAETKATYVLTADLQPHTIGPSGTFEIAGRPVSVEEANLINGVTRHPLNLRDGPWWMTLRAPSVTGIPTDLWFEPTWPNGNLHLWPVPDANYSLELLTRVVLSSLALGDTFSMPPGYERAVVLTLAEELSGPAARPISPDLERRARQARATTFANNERVPLLTTADAGMPGWTLRRHGGLNLGPGVTVTLGSLSSSALTEDPASPAEGAVWVLQVSTSPLVYQIRTRHGGTNYTLYQVAL